MAACWGRVVRLRQWPCVRPPLNIHPMEWIARIVGAFYVFAGLVLIRQAILNWRMERIKLRRQATNAFFVYSGAAVFVLWAAQRGSLT